MIKRSQTAHDNTAFISGANSPTSAARPHKASETSFWAYLSPKPPTWVLHGAPWCSMVLHGAPWCSMVLHVLGTVQARGKWMKMGFYHDELPCDFIKKWTPGLNCSRQDVCDGLEINNGPTKMPSTSNDLDATDLRRS